MTTQARQNGMADAIVAVDENCRITSFNAEAERLTGRRAEDALGHRFCEAVWLGYCRLVPDTTYCAWRYVLEGRPERRRTGPRSWDMLIGDKLMYVLVGVEGCTTPSGARGAVITLQEEGIPTPRGDLP